MRCQLRTQQRLLFDGEAQMVVARSPNGAFAIMDGHAPLLAVLEVAPVRIKTRNREEHTFAVLAGLLRVFEDKVTILAGEAIPAEEIHLPAVRDRIAEIQEELTAATAQGKDKLDEELATLRAQARAKEGNV